MFIFQLIYIIIFFVEESILYCKHWIKN